MPDRDPVAARDRAVHDATYAVDREVLAAMEKFPPFNSGHEGWAVIREEMDELWEHVRANRSGHAAARQEAIQIAAMAVRYVVDVCDA